VVALKRAAPLLFLPLALLACGQVADNWHHTATRASSRPGAPAPTPCVEASLPPQGVRLAAPRRYSVNQTDLAVVEARVQPRISAADAFAAVGYQSASSCGIKEELAYWSSDSGRRPSPRSAPGGPLAGSGLLQVRPHQTHLPARPGVGIHLAHRLCPQLGSGPCARTDPWVQPVPARLSCTSITFVDATTEKRSEYTSQAPT
jgi:hypothetical protein